MGAKKIKTEPLVDMEQAIEATGIDGELLRDKKLRDKYAIPYYSVGKKIKYKISDLFEWIEDRKVEGR